MQRSRGQALKAVCMLLLCGVISTAFAAAASALVEDVTAKRIAWAVAGIVTAAGLGIATAMKEGGDR